MFDHSEYILINLWSWKAEWTKVRPTGLELESNSGSITTRQMLEKSSEATYYASKMWWRPLSHFFRHCEVLKKLGLKLFYAFEWRIWKTFKLKNSEINVRVSFKKNIVFILDKNSYYCYSIPLLQPRAPEITEVFLFNLSFFRQSSVTIYTLTRAIYKWL